MKARAESPPQSDFFSVRLRSVPVNVPLPCSLYLMFGTKPIIFRAPGDVLSPVRMKKLLDHGVKSMLISKAEKIVYRDFLWESIRSQQTSSEARSLMVRGASFIQAEELLTSDQLETTFSENAGLLRESCRLTVYDLKNVSQTVRQLSHDDYTYNHCVNVSAYAVALMRQVNGANGEGLYEAALAGLFHDIGERGVSPKILQKGEYITPQERAEIEKHPLYGFTALKVAARVPHGVKRVVLEHHENYDGSGYPRRLSGKDLSLLSRVVTICDVFDALTSDRPFRVRLSQADALALMQTMQPGKFDPELFDIFRGALSP